MFALMPDAADVKDTLVPRLIMLSRNGNDRGKYNMCPAEQTSSQVQGGKVGRCRDLEQSGDGVSEHETL